MIYQTIRLGCELLISLISIQFNKPNYLRAKPIGLEKLITGPLILIRFAEVIDPLIGFSLATTERKEIVLRLHRMTMLIEEGFDNDILTQENFPEVFKNINTKNPLILDLVEVIQDLKSLISHNPYYDNFVENVIRAWATHKVRDPKQIEVGKVSFAETLKAAEERGSFYFLAFAYILNPKNSKDLFKNLVQSSGAWFQIIDDYDDRKKDIGKRNTPFTTSPPSFHKEMYQKYILGYKQQIKNLTPQSGPLIQFFDGLVGLVKIKSILKPKSDWH